MKRFMIAAMLVMIPLVANAQVTTAQLDENLKSIFAQTYCLALSSNNYGIFATKRDTGGGNTCLSACQAGGLEFYNKEIGAPHYVVSNSGDFVPAGAELSLRRTAGNQILSSARTAQSNYQNVDVASVDWCCCEARSVTEHDKNLFKE